MAAGWIQRSIADTIGTFKGKFWAADTTNPNTSDNAPANIGVDVNFAPVMGEVQATPTANTVLDRLKALFTAQTATNTKLDTAITDLGAIQTSGAASATAALQTAGNASLTAINTAIAAIQASTATTATASTDTSDVNIKGPPSAIVPVAVPGATTVAYATGNCIGTLMTFNGLSRGANLKVLLQEAVLMSKSVQSFACDVIVFNALPTAFVDHAAYSLGAADFDKVACRISIASTDWCASAIACFADPQFNPKLVASDGSSDCYVQLVSRGAFTLAATTDLKITLKGSPD